VFKKIKEDTKVKRDIVKELKSNPNIYAECPECGEAFPLRKAVIFYVDGPIPKEVQKVIDERKQEIIERRKELAARRKKLKERVEKATLSVNVGRIIEKVAPAINGFNFDRRDCRTLFEPIDYLVFSGLSTGKGNVDSIFFIDIKTGRARLNEHQRQIKDAVENGRVEWDQYGGKI